MAGALVSCFMYFMLVAWKKRRDRQRRRDLQIKRAFTARPEERSRPFKASALSSSSDKPLPIPGQKSITQASKPRPLSGPDHIITQLNGRAMGQRDDTTMAPPSIAELAADDFAGQSKRQSFPEALQIGRPRRQISISAAGLLSPVAATHSLQDPDTFNQVIKQLRMQTTTLFEQIEMHVDNFYHSHRPAGHGSVLSATQQGKLQDFDSPHLDDSIAGLLPYASDARELLKHCIVETMISRIDYTSRKSSGDALLPSGLLSTYRLVSSSPASSSSLAENRTNLRRWRTETISLLGIETVERSMSPQIQTLAAGLIDAFQPWAVTRYGTEARTSHLSKVLREAVELGLQIFGMPHGARRSWVVGPGGKFAVFPGLAIGRYAGVDESARSTSQEINGSTVDVVSPVYSST